MMERSGQRLFNRPPACEAFSERRRGNPNHVCPFGDTQCPSVEREKSITTLIAGLLVVGGPSAIAWFVALVVVDAIDRCFGWPCTHIGQEVREIQPALADGNPAATISSVRGIRRVSASLKNPHPDDVFGGPALVPRGPVSDGCASTEAAATGDIAGLQVLDRGQDYLAAKTSALPDDRRPAAAISWSDGCQCSETVAGEIGLTGAVGVALTDARGFLTHQTSATASVARLKAITGAGDFVPAETFTSPRHFASPAMFNTAEFGRHGQSPERSTDQVQNPGHVNILAYSALTCFTRRPIHEVLADG